jgi:transcriptional regulator with XRE-family HTH domain
LCHIADVNNTRNERYLKAFGDHLRKVRKKQGITMMQLAFEADIEYSQVAKIERGLSNTTVSTVYLLAQALDVKPAELFEFNFPPKASK